MKLLTPILMKIDFNAMLDTLPIMGKGMLGIFLVTGVIILTIALLNRLTSPHRKKSSDTDSGQNP